MFGIKNKINDGMLYLLNDMVENQVVKAKKEISELSPEEIERRKFLTGQIAHYEKELARFKIGIEKQLLEKFQFSVEELYAMYGQYDNKYISIEFHKFSESAKKYGRNISGVLTYYKKEREELEKIITEENVSRTNGTVRINCSKIEELTNKQKKELIEIGFKAGDVYEIYASNYPAVKSFKQIGIKEIPNTITVDFDPTDFDPIRAYLWICNQKLKTGERLIDEELAKFCGFSLFVQPDSEKFDLIKQVLPLS